MPKSTGHRATLGAYIRAGRHMLSETRAKTLQQIAVETGMSRSTVSYWLKADHRDEWLAYWPTVEALWTEWRKDKPPPMSFDDMPDFDPASDDIR